MIDKATQDKATVATASHLYSLPGSNWPRLLGRLIIALGLGLSSASGSAVEAHSTKLEIRSTRWVEMELSTFVVMPFVQRTLSTKPGVFGYRPYVPLPAKWSGPLKLTWSFGDGSKPVVTGSHVSAKHRYQKPGRYVVKVSASDTDGVYATGKLEVHINKTPPSPKFRAAQRVDGGLTVQFTGADAGRSRRQGYKMHYNWDFGDGSSREGDDLWQVTHQYKKPGRYVAVLTATDQDGDKFSHERKINVIIANTDTTQAKATNTESTETPKVVINGFQGNANGAVSGALNLKLLPIAQTPYYLVQSKGKCQLKFSVWDDATLTSGYVSLSIARFKEKGASYRILNPRVSMSFDTDPAAYQQKRLIQTGEPGAPGSSPFGLLEPMTFRGEGGQIDLVVKPGEYVLGELAENLRHYKATKPKQATMSLQGKFSINLQEMNNLPGLAVRPSDNDIDTYVKRNIWRQMKSATACADATFAIKSKWPPDLSKHNPFSRKRIKATFTEPVDITTLNTETFEVGYPDKEMKFVKLDGRILVGPKRAEFVPDKSLLPGVTYSARFKTGDDGVRSIHGDPLTAPAGNAWAAWSFTTELDFESTSDGSVELACHVYQSVRDPLLIAGKPAVMRVYAKWRPHNNVHPSAQVQEFLAIASAGPHDKSYGSTEHVFIRPDLYEKKRIDIARAEHTAQVYFTPKTGSDNPVYAYLAVKRTAEGKALKLVNYATRCPMKIWDLQPELTVDVYVMPENENLPKLGLLELPLIKRFLEEVNEYAIQQLPIKGIKFSAPHQLEKPNATPNIPWTTLGYMCGYVPPPGNGNQPIFPGYAKILAERSKADIAVVLGSFEQFEGGGSTWEFVKKDAAAVVTMSLDSRSIIFDRLVFGLVHEFGHALSLNHVPYIETGETSLATRIRESRQPVWFQGIEGFRQELGLKNGWNKSSIEGNAQDDWIMPLMFPGTLPRNIGFIMNHQYRQIQNFMEALDKGNKWPGLVAKCAE